MLQKIDSQEVLVYAMCFFHEDKMVRVVVSSIRAFCLNADYLLDAGTLHGYVPVGLFLQRLQLMSDILCVLMY